MSATNQDGVSDGNEITFDEIISYDDTLTLEHTQGISLAASMVKEYIVKKCIIRWSSLRRSKTYVKHTSINVIIRNIL